jgi:hypothetical protein
MHATLRTLGLALALAAAAQGPAHAFSSGSGTCSATLAAAMPMGMGTLGTGGYSVALAGGGYVPGQPVTVTLSHVSNQAFKGLLIYAADSQGNRVGSFAPTATLQNMPACSPEDAHLTHTSAVLKTVPLTLTWTPPATDVGPVTFNQIVLLGFNSYFVFVSPSFGSDLLLRDGFEP